MAPNPDTDTPTSPQAAHGEARPASKLGEAFNPFYGPQLENPYPFYARARREEPVFYSPLLKMWYVTRYDDIVTVLKDPVRFSSAQAVAVPLEYTPETQHAIQTSYLSAASLTNNDPPSHTIVRRMVHKAFTERQVADLEARIRAIAEDLLNQFAGEGRAEFIRQFSFPLPMRVILNVLGVPEDDMTKLKRWADDWIALVAAPLSPDQQAEVIGRLLESQDYWTRLIEERRERPRNDLLSDLVRASQEEETPVSLAQMISACAMLVLAGHETTTNLLGHCLYRLLTLPDQFRLVCEDPANIPRAIEETLRADTSVQALMRTTTEPVELGGAHLPKGAQLALLFASANHDEAYFTDADRFDLRRTDPKGHLAFGHGIHFCIGAPLARLEGRIALELLLQRLPGLRLAPNQQITYVVNPIHRGLKELQIEWDV